MSFTHAILTGVTNDPWFDTRLLRSRNVRNSYALALGMRGRKYKDKFGIKDAEVPLQYRAVCFIKGAIGKFKCYIDYSEYLLRASGELPSCLSNVKCVFAGSTKMGVEYTLNVSIRLKVHAWNEVSGYKLFIDTFTPGSILQGPFPLGEWDQKERERGNWKPK
ncbi:hypothetical protein FRB91_005060 [Serendipita sp. 411]|nr:hypothetical protein FRB91_005060 [Serendipita sp. 411]